MSLSPQVCKKSYKVAIPTLGDNCEFWLITVTDESGITNPNKDHAYLTDSGKLYIYNGKTLIQVNCDICFTQEERDKLEGIEEGANKYVLPVASSTELGGVLLGYTQDERNYPVLKDDNGRIYVQVPWVEYSLPIAKADTLGGIKTGYEQNGRFYPVLVDVDGNAYVNVPWTDTDTKYNVVSTTENGLAPMLPTENADKKFLNGEGEWVEANDSINGNTVTGSTFSGETSDCGVQILEIQGKTTQQTTQGYQLFDQSKLSTKSQGGATVTNNGDGSFTVSGSGNLTEHFNTMYYDYSKEETKKLLKAGTLYGKVELDIFPTAGILIFHNGDWSELNLLGTITRSLEITEDMLNSDDLYMRIRFYGNNGSPIKTGTVKPMLYQDGTGEFEPFTGGQPSPSPDYPQEIENVEISEITSHGRNLLPYPYYCGGIGVKNTQSGIDFEILPDKSFKLSGTATDSCYINLARIDYGGHEFQTNNYIGLVGNTNNNITLSYNTNNKITSIYVVQGATIDTIVCPMISKGQTVPEWEAPTGYNTISTNLTLAQDDVYNNNQITRARKQITFDGSSDEAWRLVTTNENTLRFDINGIPDKSSASSPDDGKCNRFILSQGTDNLDYEHARFSSSVADAFVIIISKDRLTSQDVNGFKTWLQSNPVIVEYELATPTTEEFKIPTIPSYEPYTEISTNSEVEPTITFRPLPFTTCLVGEATEEESGYMPPLSGNSNEFLNGNGEWSVPSGNGMNLTPVIKFVLKDDTNHIHFSDDTTDEQWHISFYGSYFELYFVQLVVMSNTDNEAVQTCYWGFVSFGSVWPFTGPEIYSSILFGGDFIPFCLSFALGYGVVHVTLNFQTAITQDTYFELYVYNANQRLDYKQID